MSFSHKKVPLTFSYSMNGCVLERVKNYPYLGVTISDNLSWSGHIHNVTCKSNRTLGRLRRNLWHCKSKSKRLHTNAWSVHSSNTTVQSETRTSKLISVTLKWFSAVLPGSSVESTVVKRGSSRASSRNWVGNPARAQEVVCLTLFYKIVNKHVAVDTGNLLHASTRNTRSNCALSPAFINIQTTKDCYKYSFYPRTVADWNQLSRQTHEVKSVDTFKALLCIPAGRSPSFRLAASPPPVQTAHVISLVEFVCLNHQNQPSCIYLIAVLYIRWYGWVLLK